MKLAKLSVLLIICSHFFAQSGQWATKVFNNVLTFQLPANANYDSSTYIKAMGGELGLNFYGFQYYDSVFNHIDNEHDFEVSLVGFISGRTSDPALEKYDVVVKDTVLNGMPGLLARYVTTDTSLRYKEIYYYVTMADSKYCWFYVYSPSLNGMDGDVKLYFRSIEFNTNRLREKSFRLSAVHLTRKS